MLRVLDSQELLHNAQPKFLQFVESLVVHDVKQHSTPVIVADRRSRCHCCVTLWWHHHIGPGNEQVVELEGPVSTCVVAGVTDGGHLAVCRPTGGVLYRLSTYTAPRRRTASRLSPLQDAQKRMHPQLPGSTELPLPGKLFFRLLPIYHAKISFGAWLKR